MINPLGPKCRLSMKYSKSEEDVIITYPKGKDSDKHALLLLALFDDHTLTTLKDLGYDPQTLKVSIQIDWSNPKAKETFSDLYQKIKDSVPTSLDNQLSLWDDHEVQNEKTTRKEAKAYDGNSN